VRLRRARTLAQRSIQWLTRPIITKHALLLAFAVGLALRLATIWTRPPQYDGTAYMALADSIANGDGLVAPWGRFDDPFSSSPELTDLSPLFPAYLASFYRALGFSIEATQWAGFLLGVLVLATAFWASSDLYGRSTGLLTCAVLAVVPALILFPGMEWADNLPVLFFILALWGLIRGLRNNHPWFFAAGGFALALFALSKAHEIGVVTATLAAAGFLAWRMWEKGPIGLRSLSTWAFLGGFLLPVGAWLAWGPRPPAGPVLAARPPFEVMIGAFVKLLFVVVASVLIVGFFLPELRLARGAWHTEEGRLLWSAAVALPLLVWVLLSTSYASGTSPWEPAWKAEQARHLVPAFVPILWLAAPHVRDSPADGWTLPFKRMPQIRHLAAVAAFASIPFVVWIGTFEEGLLFAAVGLALMVRWSRVRILLLLVLAILIASNGALAVSNGPHVAAGNWLRDHATPGDAVAVDPWVPFENGTVIPGPTCKYELYPYLAELNLRVIPYAPGVNATFVFSYRTSSLPGYQMVAGFSGEYQPGPLSRLWDGSVTFLKGLSGERPSAQSTEPTAWILAREP